MRVNRTTILVEMAKRRMTQLELSKISNVSRSTINNVCCGKSCSENTARKIAYSLSIPIEELVIFED